MLLARVVGWAMANWLLDAASLWVFLRAFGGSIAIDGLLVSFGLANIVAVIPLTPGGLGFVEGVYVPTLVGFGLDRATATVGVLSYRVAQLWFPIVLGGVMYLSLRVGPWSIERRDRLQSMASMMAGGRHVAHQQDRLRRGVAVAATRSNTEAAPRKEP